MLTRLFLVPIFIALVLMAHGSAAYAQNAAPNGSIPTAPVALINGEFECPNYVDSVDDRGRAIRIPAGWTLLNIDRNAEAEMPVLFSAREWFARSCDSDAFVEHLEGRDALFVRAQDIETPPNPGKPFDAAVYQQVAVEPGGAYSVSGWFVSLCGGSFADPNDCPADYYMAKLLGMDARGGIDPLAASVVWEENRNNFVEADGRTRVGWQNLRLAAVAEEASLTVFARINSPFQWHGNHAFIDAVKIVRAPAAMFGPLPAAIADNRLTLSWLSEQSPDVTAIPGGTYRLYIDVQVRPAGGDWRELVVDGGETGEVEFVPRCANTQYDFRLRARAEQPPADEAGESAWPNHRFPGVWSEPVPIFFAAPALPLRVDDELPVRSFLPIIVANADC